MRNILLLSRRGEELYHKVVQKLERRKMHKNLTERAQEFMLKESTESSVDS